MIRAKEEHQKIQTLENNALIVEKLMLIQSIAQDENRNRKKSVESEESIESFKKSSDTDLDLPPETCMSKQKTEDASMLRSIASSVYTNKTASFNAAFKKSIHKVGLNNIVGKNLYMIYAVYLAGLVVGLIYIGIRAGLLAKISSKLKEQHDLTEQVSYSQYFHRFQLLSNQFDSQNLSLGYAKGAQYGFYNTENNLNRFKKAMENYRGLASREAEYLWTTEYQYYLKQGLSIDLTLGDFYLQELNRFNELITSHSVTDDGWSNLNFVDLMLNTYDTFDLLKNEIFAVLGVQVYLFVGAIVIMILVTVVLVWVFILISREINEFFSRCSVIFERLDDSILETEMGILEAGLNADEMIFDKVVSFTVLRTGRTFSKKNTKYSKPGIHFEPTFGKEEAKKESAPNKKEAAVRIMLPHNGRKVNRRQDTSKPKRRGTGIKEKKTAIIIIVCMILVCLNFPILVDWLSNITIRSNIEAWLQIDQDLQLLLQFGSSGSSLLLLKMSHDLLPLNQGMAAKISQFEGLSNTYGYKLLFDDNQLISKYLGTSYLNSNLCEWPGLTKNRVSHCIAFSKGIEQFSILNAASSVQQYTKEAITLVDAGQQVNLTSNLLLSTTFQMQEIIEEKLQAGLKTSLERFSTEMSGFLLGKSILFSAILVGSLLLILGLHYNRWLAPTSLFWRRVARTLSILPKNILLHSNFFMKAHFERLIKLKF